jgi:predicted ATPase/DNA-binding CsgD family transcriptional regulator
MKPAPSTDRNDNLPRPLTPFIGRQSELADIGRRLAEPTCRLLTLVGAGGMGKTRLAIEAARQIQSSPDGVYFVDLQSVAAVESLATAVADALQFPLAGPESAHAQLADYLAGRELLLLLDSFEHLLDGAAQLSEWLRTAPGLKLLITARLALELQEEWLYRVGGLEFPPPGPEPNHHELLTFSAVRLFDERARRLNPGFSLSNELAPVIRICRLVEGMPLALELAAAWTKTLSCADVAAEIVRNLDFLASNRRNIPERQRSIQAVFDYAWQRLDGQEQTVFRRLSVFRGGFTWQSAAAVAGANPFNLSTLMDQSLLERQPDGRYRLHSLLRQYAREKLAVQPDELAQTRQRHAEHFIAFLAERLTDLMGRRQRPAMAEFETELDNVRAAVAWSLECKQLAAIRATVLPLATYLELRGRYLEAGLLSERGIAIAREAEPTPEMRLTLAGLLVELSWIYLRFGRLGEAAALAEEARELYRELSQPPIYGHSTDPLLVLGLIATVRGDYAAALALGQEGLQTSQSPDHPWNRQFAYYVLAGAALAQGDYQQAQLYAKGMYAAVEATGDRWTTAYGHIMLGDLAVAMGDEAAAQDHFEASYALRQEFDDPEGMAIALIRLAQLAEQRQAYSEAQQMYERSYELYQEINDRGGLATALHGLGRTAAAQERFQIAQEQYHQALKLAVEIQYVSLIHSLLISIGDWLTQIGQARRGLSLLALVTSHPSSPHEAKTRAERHLALRRPGEDAAILKAAVQEGQTSSLDAVLAELLTDLAGAVLADGLTEPAASSPSSPQLVEQLTAREFEVLQLMAGGRTNHQIADELVISAGTVKYYTSQIYGKLNVHNRTEAVSRARELQLLP